MREIKFRAWDKEKGKMFTVFHWHKGDDIDSVTRLCGFNGEETLFVGSDIDLIQYTGLKDKDKVEIYEGDIIAIGLTYKIVKAVIEWNDKDACFGCKWDADTARVRKEVGMPNLPANLVSSGSPWAVIGNIYENPELLEVNDGHSN